MVSFEKYEIRLIIAPSNAGERLDKVLARLRTDVSRSQITKWIQSGEVLVDGRVAHARDIVRGNEQITISAQYTGTMQWDKAEAISFDIVFEDQHIIVVDKPSGLVVHPGSGNTSGTLVNGLLHHRGELSQLPRAGIVHRLDKDTTGLMVVACTAIAQTALVRSIANHEVERSYEAIVEGVFDVYRRFDSSIGRHSKQRTKQQARTDGRVARTYVKPKNIFRAHTLVEARLGTGRTHQIRVHLSGAGFPLVGDSKYGARRRLPQKPAEELIKAVRYFPRQALHSRKLEFRHPVKGELLSFRSNLPEDMRLLLDALRIDAEG